MQSLYITTLFVLEQRIGSVEVQCGQSAGPGSPEATHTLSDTHTHRTTEGGPGPGRPDLAAPIQTL